MSEMKFTTVNRLEIFKWQMIMIILELAIVAMIRREDKRELRALTCMSRVSTNLGKY